MHLAHEQLQPQHCKHQLHQAHNHHDVQHAADAHQQTADDGLQLKGQPGRHAVPSVHSQQYRLSAQHVHCGSPGHL